MENRNNLIFFAILLAALITVLVATGAMPLIVQLLTAIFQAIASAVQGLIAR
jgi:hypothetical protein